MKSAPIAIPTPHTIPIAESGRIFERELLHSMPRAERMAKIIAPSMGLAFRYNAMPRPPNEACVIPPQRNTIRFATMYVPIIPQVMPERIQAIRAFDRN